jgi:ribosomal protein L11 methylase PrmA
MHYSKKQLPEIMVSWPNGIPLTTIQQFLPWRSRFSLFTYLHIHLNAKYSLKKGVANNPHQKFPRRKLENLIGSLESLVTKLKTPVQTSTWSEYYEEAGQRAGYLERKKSLISEWIKELKPVRIAIDLGANEGEFSQILSNESIEVVSADFDPYCINNLYKKIKERKISNIQPLVIDLSNPSPAIGWNNEEREPFLKRAKADLVVALALIHHLAIGKNIPFMMIASVLSEMSKTLIIEYVPKDDEKVQQMLSYKTDIYTDYTRENFEFEFGQHYELVKKAVIGNSKRILYMFKKVNN